MAEEEKINYFKRLILPSGPSSMRFIAITTIINIMVVWTLVCIKKLDIVDIPWGVLGMAGLVLTGKVWQSGIEIKNGNGKCAEDDKQKKVVDDSHVV